MKTYLLARSMLAVTVMTTLVASAALVPASGDELSELHQDGS